MTRTRWGFLIAAVVVGIFIVVVGGLALVKVLVIDRTVNAPLETISISAKDKVLIIAPHPDDETLGPGAFADQAIKAGAKVKAVIVTAGDGNRHSAQINNITLRPKPKDYRRLGEIRHKESVAAMKELGVTDLTFLGFADGSTNGLWRVSWDDNKPRPGRNGCITVPYDFAYRKGAVYSGNSLAESLSAVVKDYKPTIIIYPTAEDWHHDHWAVNAFVQYVLAANKIKTREYTYLVHHGSLWPSPPFFLPPAPLQPPAGLAETDALWFRYPVNKSIENEKLAAVRKYKSQTRLSAMMLESFVRTNELFAVYPKEKTARVSTPPSFLEGNKLPGVVINDYEASELSMKLGGKGDIRRLAFVYDNTSAYVAVGFKEPQSANIVTMINMRFFTPSGVDRLDVRVQNVTVVPVKAAENSIAPAVELIKNNSMVVIKVPVSVLGGAKTMMLNVDTFRDKQTEDAWLDRTAWRRIELQ
jgi:N-acetyl-1-D-myo-inositol-2-amino-2-deoxy-alpha-D-glucopyranoside deacetylase